MINPKLETPEPTREQLVVLLPHIIERIESDPDYYTLEPWTCATCLFDARTRESYHEIANDTSEAHYFCPIYNTEIWGEKPICGPFFQKALLEWLKISQKAIETSPPPTS